MGSIGNLVTKLQSEEAVQQEEAMVALVQLAHEHADWWDIPEFPEALTGIVRVLSQDESPNLQEYAAWALGNLSAAHSPNYKHRIARFPLVVAGLVSLLSTEHAGAREEAVRALRNLSCAAENNALIAHFPDAFPGLVKLLFDDSVPGVQFQAIMTVLNLLANALATRQKIKVGLKRKVEKFPDAMDSLVTMWFSEVCRKSQAKATSAIVKLVDYTLADFDVGVHGGRSGNVEKIVDFPSALAKLLKLLFQSLGAKAAPPNLRSKCIALEKKVKVEDSPAA